MCCFLFIFDLCLVLYFLLLGSCLILDLVAIFVMQFRLPQISSVLFIIILTSCATQNNLSWYCLRKVFFKLFFSNRLVKHNSIWAAANQFQWRIWDSPYRDCWYDQLSAIILVDTYEVAVVRNGTILAYTKMGLLPIKALHVAAFLNDV